MNRRTCLLAAGLGIAGLLRAQPLWPGARYTVADRDRAVERGLQYIYQLALRPEAFKEYGSDLLWCFYTISATAKNPKLRGMASTMGRERAAAWRKLHPRIPEGIGADDLSDFIFGADAADRLGAPDAALKSAVVAAVSHYSAVDFLGFDPAGPPPADLPKPCPRCNRRYPRGTTACPLDGAALVMQNRYDLWSDALITAYTGDLYGVQLGASYADVVRWIPAMRPYRSRRDSSYADFIDTTYAITHVVYTLNDYGLYRLSPRWLPEEYRFLRDNLVEAIRLHDPETMGEFLDTLRAFGLTESDPLIQQGVAFVLSTQNADGSWGDPKDPDIYNRYHTTWTAVDGLREYAWRGERSTGRFGRQCPGYCNGLDQILR